jgi:hypothetical protein
MKNRKREICTSGSVRDEDGQPPHLLGRRKFLHLAAAAAALPAVSRLGRAQAYPTRQVTIIVGFPVGGGIFALWSNDRLDDAFTARLRRIFADARAEEVTFHNPLQDNPFTQTVYLAKKQAVPRWAAPAS